MGYPGKDVQEAGVQPWTSVQGATQTLYNTALLGHKEPKLCETANIVEKLKTILYSNAAFKVLFN